MELTNEPHGFVDASKKTNSVLGPFALNDPEAAHAVWFGYGGNVSEKGGVWLYSLMISSSRCEITGLPAAPASVLAPAVSFLDGGIDIHETEESEVSEDSVESVGDTGRRGKELGGSWKAEDDVENTVDTGRGKTGLGGSWETEDNVEEGDDARKRGGLGGDWTACVTAAVERGDGGAGTGELTWTVYSSAPLESVKVLTTNCSGPPVTLFIITPSAPLASSASTYCATISVSSNLASAIRAERRARGSLERRCGGPTCLPGRPEKVRRGLEDLFLKDGLVLARADGHFEETCPSLPHCQHLNLPWVEAVVVRAGGRLPRL